VVQRMGAGHDVQLLALYYQIRDLPQEAAAVMDVVTKLNTDTDSPIKGKIMTLDADKGTWVRNSSMKQWLSPILASGGVLYGKTVPEQTEIIKAYLKGSGSCGLPHGVTSKTTTSAGLQALR